MPEPITIGILVCAGAGASVGVHSLLQRGYYSLKDWIYSFFYGKKLYSRDDANDIFAAITLYLHENFKANLINSATITININSGKDCIHLMVPSPGEYIELSKGLYIYSESRDGLRVDGYKIWYKTNPTSLNEFKRLIKQLKSDAINIGKLLDNKHKAKLKKLSPSQESSSSSQTNPVILNIPTKN